MKPSKSMLRKHLKILRNIIKTTEDSGEMRIAQGVKYGIEWATQYTVGWHKPAQEVEALAGFLKSDYATRPPSRQSRQVPHSHPGAPPAQAAR